MGLGLSFSGMTVSGKTAISFPTDNFQLINALKMI